jgi:hypothetical protein
VVSERLDANRYLGNTGTLDQGRQQLGKDLASLLRDSALFLYTGMHF